MEEQLRELLKEIENCYALASQDLLEKQRLDILENDIEKRLREDVKENIDDEILSLKIKKLYSGWKTQLKPGFHNISTAHSRLESKRILINEILSYLRESSQTLKNRFEAEGLFIEARSKENGDLNLLIGSRDGRPEKAHAILDEKTGEIRVEDNQLEPLELVRKLESILTLPSGKKIRVTRESIEEISDDSNPKQV